MRQLGLAQGRRPLCAPAIPVLGILICQSEQRTRFAASATKRKSPATENVELGPKPLWARPELWYAGAAAALGDGRRKRISIWEATASPLQAALLGYAAGRELTVGETREADGTLEAGETAVAGEAPLALRPPRWCPCATGSA